MTKPSRVRLSPSTRDTEEEESEEHNEESRLAELGNRMPDDKVKVNFISTCRMNTLGWGYKTEVLWQKLIIKRTIPRRSNIHMFYSV